MCVKGVVFERSSADKSTDLVAAVFHFFGEFLVIESE